MPTMYEIILKLSLGTLLGGIIGFERQTHGRPAGFRTQLLVCVACVLLMIISEGYYAGGAATPGLFRIDPTRIAAGAMTGVGFLGAGVILKTGASVQGLTTAACIWIVSAIGLAIGAGQYAAAVGGFVITFISLWFLRILEARMPRTIYKYISLLTDWTGDEDVVRKIFEEQGFSVIRMDYAVERSHDEKTFIFTVAGAHTSPIRKVMENLSNLGFIKRIEIRS
ncbi:MAG: MgtC/SapB family protein [Nitrospirae bacterium]|nr:MgtC/SapB family protein [Nitrospirota bacterium]